MPSEARQHPRAQLAGIDVRYADAGGAPVVARARDIGRGGLFVETATLLPIGETRDLELRIAGEEGVIEAVARVVWARTREEDPRRPVGMAFAFVEVDPAAVDRIGALVAGRERTISGLGHRPDAPPPGAAAAIAMPSPTQSESRDTAVGLPREPTLGGVGGRTSHPLREQTLIGVGEDGARPPEPERSIPIGLVAKKPAAAERAVDASAPRLETRAVSLAEEDDAPRKGRGSMLVALLVFLLVVGAGYAFRERLGTLIGVAPPDAPAAHVSAAPSAPAVPAVPAPSPAPPGVAVVADAGSSLPSEAGATDASAEDAAIADAAVHDAAARGALHHGAAAAPLAPVPAAGAKKGASHPPKPKPAPSALPATTPTGEPENPY